VTLSHRQARIAVAFYLYVSFVVLLCLIALVLSVITGQWALAVISAANIIVNTVVIFLFREVIR